MYRKLYVCTTVLFASRMAFSGTVCNHQTFPSYSEDRNSRSYNGYGNYPRSSTWKKETEDVPCGNPYSANRVEDAKKNWRKKFKGLSDLHNRLSVKCNRLEDEKLDLKKELEQCRQINISQNQTILNLSNQISTLSVAQVQPKFNYSVPAVQTTNSNSFPCNSGFNLPNPYILPQATSVAFNYTS